jgi:DNA/RNA-binding domain of Phe-tRNA-synthetase-like protein
MQHRDFQPAIAPEVWALQPDFAALSIIARGISNTPGHDWARTQLAAAAAAIAASELKPWAARHLESWAEAYRAFGAKPQRTPCSAEALLKRAGSDGQVPSVNPLVDLYNAVSLRHAIPVGGEDMASYLSYPRLVRAGGSETFDTMKDGSPATETADAGEVVWRDDAGVTCRRWNWRQSVRTRVTAETVDVWFILESLAPMPLAALQEAGDELVHGLRHLSPSAAITVTLLQKEGA